MSRAIQSPNDLRAAFLVEPVLVLALIILFVVPSWPRFRVLHETSGSELCCCCLDKNLDSNNNNSKAFRRLGGRGRLVVNAEVNHPSRAGQLI